MRKASSHCGQNGSALVYILIAIALLGALTVTFMSPSSQQTSSQSGFRVVSDIQSQISTITSAIQECVLLYKAGDKSIDTGSSGSDPSARKNYPIKPNSSHYDTATVGPTTGTQYVRDIRCPGNPGNSDENHAPIFGGTTGKFLPPPPSLFDEWQYYNGQDGVFFWIRTNKTDRFIDSALEKLDEKYGECEADIIETSSSDVRLDSETPAEVVCEAGYTCFRVRMIINSSADYSGDSDGDESSCP